MKSRFIVLVAYSALLPWTTAFAHRIDEYLQATIFSLDENRIQASMRLVPGVVVASAVIANIDRNGDGAFSDEEERAYAQRVLDDLTITADSQTIRPKLISWSFPEAAQLRGGLGKIHIDYALRLPAAGTTRHVTVENHHLNNTSVYLMNVLAPKNPGIVLMAQRRNPRQSRYELEYQQQGDGRSASLTWWDKAHIWLEGIIEAMQMLVVAAVLPSLILLGATRAYPILRIGGVLFAGAAAVGWTVERLLGLDAKVDRIVDAFAGHAVLLSVGLLAISLVCRLLAGDGVALRLDRGGARGLQI